MKKRRDSGVINEWTSHCTAAGLQTKVTLVYFSFCTVAVQCWEASYPSDTRVLRIFLLPSSDQFLLLFHIVYKIVVYKLLLAILINLSAYPSPGWANLSRYPRLAPL